MGMWNVLDLEYSFLDQYCWLFQIKLFWPINLLSSTKLHSLNEQVVDYAVKAIYLVLVE